MSTSFYKYNTRFVIDCGVRDVCINMTKICTKCNQEKPSSQFTVRKGRNHCYTQCSDCRKMKAKLWRKFHKQQCIESGNLWRATEKIINPLGERARMLNSSIRSHSNAKGQIKEIGRQYLIDLYHKQEGKCFYTGLPMKLHSNTLKDFLLMSVDKIESTKGYIPSNVVLCCWGINLLKAEHSVDDLYKYLALFYNAAALNGKIK